MADEAELRGEVVRVAQALDRAGFCPSKSGNVSVRWRDGLLITPTGLPYANMRPEDVVELDLSGTQRVGAARSLFRMALAQRHLQGPSRC